MKTRNLLLFFSLFTLLTASSSAQRYDRKNQFMIGLKGGVNFTNPLISQRYSVFAPGVSSKHGGEAKIYEKFMKNMGYGGGVAISYGITRNLTLTLEGLFYQYRLSYTNNYAWTDMQSGPSVTLDRTYYKRLNYFEIPLMFRYDILARRVSPFIQAGVAPAFVHSVQANNRSQMQSSAMPSELEEQSAATDEKGSYNRFYLSAVGGAGLSFYAGKTMFLLGANGRYSILQPTSDLHRFSNGSASGNLDVQDKYRILNLELYLSVMFPIGGKCAGMPKFF